MKPTPPAGKSPGRQPPPTESANPASLGIDKKSAREIVAVIHEEDLRAWEAVGRAIDSVAKLVDRVVEAFRRGGRLIYVGAGTSGRLGALDAAECPPTFGVSSELVVGLIAGGEGALRRSVEGAEDSLTDGARAMREIQVRDRDVVCGIATSGTTPYVLGALEQASGRDATTAFICCNPQAAGSRAAELADVLIELTVGPEVIAGSTRMKGGTSTKMVLNMISTAAMIRWGKVYDNLMVDLRPISHKLRRRAVGLVSRLGQVDEKRAEELLTQAADDVKAAIVMARRGVNLEDARGLLKGVDGSLRAVIDDA